MKDKKKPSDAKTNSPRYEQAATLNGHSFEELFIDNADPTHTSEVVVPTEPVGIGIHKPAHSVLDHTDVENQNHGIQTDSELAKPARKNNPPE